LPSPISTTKWIEEKHGCKKIIEGFTPNETRADINLSEITVNHIVYLLLTETKNELEIKNLAEEKQGRSFWLQLLIQGILVFIIDTVKGWRRSN
jgi:hypothetical protein